MESSPYYSSDCENEYDDILSTEEIILKNIIYIVRTKLASMYGKGDPSEILKWAPMINLCSTSADLVQQICTENGIKCRTVIIYPGFSRTPPLYDGYDFHAFNIVTMRGYDYIVDLTYRQFFESSSCSLERIGICCLTGTMPGRFMIMNDSRKDTASRLLSDGYVLMADENLKNYFDGFAISYRNATYYEYTRDYSFTTPYTPRDYQRFIDGFDSQYIREGEEVLGFQKKVLKNPYIIFNKYMNIRK